MVIISGVVVLSLLMMNIFFLKEPKEKASESDQPSLSEVSPKSSVEEIRPGTSDLQNALLTKSKPSKNRSDPTSLFC